MADKNSVKYALVMAKLKFTIRKLVLAYGDRGEYGHKFYKKDFQPELIREAMELIDMEAPDNESSGN